MDTVCGIISLILDAWVEPKNLFLCPGGRVAHTPVDELFSAGLIDKII